MRLAIFLAIGFVRRRSSPLLRTSALAAMAAVTLGVASLVVVLALMTGYTDALRDGILASGGHLTALFPGGVDEVTGATVGRAITGVHGVSDAAEVVYAPGLLIPRDLEGARPVTVKAPGRLPPFVGTLDESAQGVLQVAIGDVLARSLQVEVGNRVALQMVVSGDRPQTVPAIVGRIFKTGFAEIDGGWVLVPLGALRARLPRLRASGIEIRLKDAFSAESLRDEIESACGGRALVATWEESNRNLFAALTWQKLSLGVVLSLVLGVGAVEIAAALVVLVTEKRRELGVLSAVGATSSLVRRTLVLVGAWLGGAGVVTGVGLGVLIAVVMTVFKVPSFPPEIASVYMVDTIPLRVAPWDVVVVIALGLFEVLLAALLPARRAAAREPADLLRWV